MSTLYEQIQVLIQAKKTPEALHHFAASGHADAQLLQGRYDRLLEDKALGRGKPEEWQISINRIHFALLELAKPETAVPEPAGDLQAQVEQLLRAGNTESALRVLVAAGRAGAEGLLIRLTTANQQFAVQEINYGQMSTLSAGIAAEILGFFAPAELARQRPPVTSPGKAGQASPLTQHDAAPLIRQAARQGDTTKAIKLLLRTGTQEGPALHEKFAAAEEQHARGLIGPGEWGRTQAQICQSIFDLDWMQASEPVRVLPAGIRPQIIRLLLDRKTEQALQLCADAGDQYLLFQAQLSAAKKQSDLGLIEPDYLELTESRINYALQAWIGQASDPTSTGVPDSVSVAAAPSPTDGVWSKVRRLWHKKA